MTKGTTSFGKRNRRSHGLCHRCGKRSWHNRQRRCASCGFPKAKMKTQATPKSKQRRTTGTGRMRYLKRVIKQYGTKPGTISP
mmetsp:Transcript_137522/g.194591  ORF Transcript_137522/g.194591 Transcript_137522/m.194591 type:complete len:83 (-) Transcript_137522:186-434(-)